MMRRFFFDPEARTGDQVFLSEKESRHVTKVLRLTTGSNVELLDGQGTVYNGVVTGTGRRVEARIDGIVATKEENGKKISVYQGLLKGEKMDTVVQKCTELGVSSMIPFQSSRCQGKLDPKQGLKKYQRWQRIGLAACKQCLRLEPMQLEMPVQYSALLSRDFGGEDALRLLFWEEEKEISLQDVPNIDKAQSIELMLGPEGGFSRDEVTQANGLGWRTVSLGDRILRAETATLTAVAIVQYLAGNLTRTFHQQRCKRGE